MFVQIDPLKVRLYENKRYGLDIFGIVSSAMEIVNQKPNLVIFDATKRHNRTMLGIRSLYWILTIANNMHPSIEQDVGVIIVMLTNTIR